MKRFGVTHEQLASGAVRVALRGELDLAHAYTLDEELRRVEQDCPSCIVIDLRELSFGPPAACRGSSRRGGVHGAPIGGSCSCADARSSRCSR